MSYHLSAFGDEISSDLTEQLNVLTDLRVNGLDLRGAWGTNVLHMTDEQVTRVKTTCAAHEVRVRCIGSPIGKSPLADPIEKELNNLARIIEVGQEVGTRNIRLFSFYPADTSTNAHYDSCVPDAIERLKALTALAAQHDMLLLHENEKGIVGDVPERCLRLLQGVDHPNLRFIWDPANFVQCGVAEQVDRYWDVLSPYIGYIHIKDARMADGGVTPAGQGDGQLKELMEHLRASGYAGTLALEPHLAIAGHSSGFSGEEGMRVAVNALRGLLRDIGWTDED